MNTLPTPLLILGATTLTALAYLLALWAYRRSGWSLLLPVLVGSTIVISVLLAIDMPYSVYRRGAQPLAWLVGPATVALALPLFRQRARLGGLWWPVLGALLAGTVTAVVSAVGIAWLLGADWLLALSLAPKSATMPVAMPVAESIGGSAPLSAASVVLTGIAAAVLASSLFTLLGLRSNIVRGFALGLSAHAIGTARAFELGETAIGFSALAMGLTAISTSVLVPLLLGWL